MNNKTGALVSGDIQSNVDVQHKKSILDCYMECVNAQGVCLKYPTDDDSLRSFRSLIYMLISLCDGTCRIKADKLNKIYEKLVGFDNHDIIPAHTERLWDEKKLQYIKVNIDEVVIQAKRDLRVTDFNFYDEVFKEVKTLISTARLLDIKVNKDPNKTGF